MEPFTKPVDTTEFPTYEDVVVHPVDFTSLERNIKRKFYGSTEAFSSDARWIVHNSVIFNGANSKVTSMARSLVKILKQDMSEIETCPDCYMNAHQKPKTWFIEACRSAHPLIWARLKGFPFWPAKAVKWRDGNVDVRFFGRHDRSWVPVKECFLFSEQMPTPLKNRNKTLESCLQEVNEHIVKLRERFGRFKYAPHRVQFNPLDADQIKIMLPNYKTPVPVRVRSQSRAFSRLSGHSDDETSSVASTDSGASVRRRKRESGTSSATQETETEAEIPKGFPERGEDEEEDKLKGEVDPKPDIEDDGDEYDEYPVGNFEDEEEDNEEASAAERQRTKTTIAPSASPNESQNSPTVSTQSAPRTSPAVSQNPSTSTSSISETTPSTATQSATQRVSSASSSSSPQTAGGNNIPPPPPLSHPQASQSSVVGPRGVFGPPPPGSQVLGMPGARGPIMSSPGLRMMTSSGPGVLIPSRMPGGPGMTPTRHLPPEAGPLSSQLHKHSQKLAEVMRATLEDVLAGLVGTGTPEARLAALQLELERTSWRHQQELAEVRHNADVRCHA
ncbi:protein kinase C-binding protein 1 [Penaeus vannamei]|uniref:Protein kinase C-binding protein 1 n=1 Tax=Penaeus vannamei TaxID=6689 RepID=A0A3R7LX09_PENVA|nr:protein kinase C-binding protein 1 [Penaeus vannamei]